MAKIRYTLEEREVEARPGETILDISLRAHIPHAHACGGTARCSTCRVGILDGIENCEPRTRPESILAERLHFGPEVRLACQTEICGDVELRRLVLDEDDVELTSQIGPRPCSGQVGEELRLAVLFADIRGFTPFAEALPPYDAIHVLNRFFRHMGRAIAAHRGQVNNYMGDGLMALFGLGPGYEARAANPGAAAEDAVNAALAMLEEMDHLKPYLVNVYGRSFEVGIGVHYGDVVVGSIGSESLRLETAIGDTVNLASRIETANKQAGTRLLVSQETYDQLKSKVNVEKIVRLQLPGKSGEYTLYALAGVET
jgi:adenylate cyclase